MSLLGSPAPAHAPALKRFAARLGAGDTADRALLLNLQEEDRVPKRKRKAFHVALAGSTCRSWKGRFIVAAAVAQRALPVPMPRSPGLTGPWWHHVGYTSLQKFKYVSLTPLRGSRPPRRARLSRPIGQRENGVGGLFWITGATSANADDIRDRLGLCLVLRGEQLYRVSIGVNRAPARALFIPSALDAGFYSAWRHPGRGHTAHWGMTRHLATDAVSEHELLALPDAADALVAEYVGLVSSDPPTGYLAVRGIT